MGETIISEILKYVIPSALTFIIGYMVSQFRKFSGYTQVIKWTTRRMLIEDCKFYCEQGFLTPKESADLEKLWTIYSKKLKLNTEGEAWYKLARALPVKIREEDKQDETK